MRNLLYLLLGLLFLPIISSAQSVEIFKEKVQKAHQSFIDGILIEDSQLVEELLAEDVSLGFPNGGFSAKQGFVDALKNKTLYYDSSSNQSVNVRIYGNVGVVNGKGDLVFRYIDESGDWYKMLEHLSFTAVYLVNGDKVKMVAWQSTRPTTDSLIKVTEN